uniref:RING-type domain-containing protein n=1 Tax=Sinocyclocheilus grahami TaxID=75366 RepID=A0A672N777_SINGR
MFLSPSPDLCIVPEIFCALPPIMSSSSGPLNEELQCSICMHVLTDPVTTPCGHNFCGICLNKFWTNTHIYFCPFCKEKYSKRPAIKINTTLREVAQHFKEKPNLGISEVFCDFCDERKQKAVKSCLTWPVTLHVSRNASSCEVVSHFTVFQSSSLVSFGEFVSHETV